MQTQTIHSCFQLRIFITIIADPANNQPLAMKYNNTLYYYVLNAQGDVVRIVNSSRSTVASYTYDPWGKIISSSGTLADINPLRYRGYYYDSETGFYYLQSRYYDPEIGRFINADSYASTDATGLLSTNMFAYCENDPVNKSDPSGEFWNIVAGAALGAGMEVLTQLATGTKLRDINWVDVAVQGAVGAVTSGTIPFRFLKTASKVVKATAKIAKNVVVSTAAEVFSQRNDKNKSIGKTATIGVQTSIDTISICENPDLVATPMRRISFIKELSAIGLHPILMLRPVFPNEVIPVAECEKLIEATSNDVSCVVSSGLGVNDSILSRLGMKESDFSYKENQEYLQGAIECEIKFVNVEKELAALHKKCTSLGIPMFEHSMPAINYVMNMET